MLLVAGLPPFPSFVGKFAMLSGALGAGSDGTISSRSWAFVALAIGTGLLSLIAMTRAGIRTFWAEQTHEGPRIRIAEGLPIVVLLAACLGLTVAAGPVSDYARDAAQALYGPPAGVDAARVGAAEPPPGDRS
jgi:multicomponent K+:H+ antiporter subunit D